jgi:hypothetical protein
MAKGRCAKRKVLVTFLAVGAMKSSQTEFTYPVFGFTADMDMWSFRNRDELTTCGRDTLKENMQDGMELIDSAGLSWRVVSVHRVGGVGLSLGLSCFLAGVSRIEHELEPQPAITLEQFKSRIARCVEAHSDVYVWEDETLEQKLDEVSRFEAFSDLETRLGLDHFRAY